jgi:uncharacterized protein (DUF1697 family)
VTAAASTQYVALLRGINVGGNNPVAMADLAECFRDAGYGDVRTVLASGNVVFTAKGTSSRALEPAIERALRKRFESDIAVVVRSRAELTAVVSKAPKGHDSPKLRADVFFLKHPLSAKQALADMPELNDDVDTIAAGEGVLYFSRVKASATKTRIQKFMALPIFKQVTVRTWGTTTKLLALLEAAD